MPLTSRSGNLPTGAFRLSPDGNRFLVNRLLQDAEAVPLTVVVNWLDGVKR